MRDRFRDLEAPSASRKKDVVLMATVSSFEGLQPPTRSELRQFAELFTPLFQASSLEAKRQAVAALSQCPQIPPAVALFVGCQSIDIAAPFLTSSPAIDDETLITIARTQGSAHMKAIVSRDALSPRVIDALVGLRQAEQRLAAPAEVETGIVPSEPPVPASLEEAEAAARRASEEEIRNRIRELARHVSRPEGDRLGLRNLSPIQAALLVRFARNREAALFAKALASGLSASRWLAERIMLDISGQQLATTLISLGLDFRDAVFVLEKLYPHLAEPQHGVTRAWMVLDSLDLEECNARVDAWRRADSYTYLPEKTETAQATHEEPPAQDRRIIRTR
ncbi:DUF2336 domain-containing protein [Rhizobium sp. RHZ02]|uniref:DUF2336 domain-containing protein n=1 Tax=unclassified Rhizobium TaxID=2613769 RepID=UPI00146A159E|nr:DUF2336 domain-containing protein [Rhizobium sp. RHZ02]MBD9446999.1 DUF2336 domain-containing protein [Rhizobium sp. RHZ01]MBD9452140.1 DUF2336 domain-containing protein [Rhizobium sp. RHZ02]